MQKQNPQNHHFNLGDWIHYHVNDKRGHGEIIEIDGDCITCEMLPGFAKSNHGHRILTDESRFFSRTTDAHHRPSRVCSFCLDVHPHKDMTLITYRNKKVQLCPTCFNRWYIRCEGCNTYHYQIGMVTAEGKPYCNDCLKKHTTICWSCGNWTHHKNLVKHNGGIFCINCRDTGKMQAYLEHVKRRDIVEIGDYLISDTSGLVQGEVIKIGTMQGFGDEIIYLVERADGKQFTIPAFDIKTHNKSEKWYQEGERL